MFGVVTYWGGILICKAMQKCQKFKGSINLLTINVPLHIETGQFIKSVDWFLYDREVVNGLRNHTS